MMNAQAGCFWGQRPKTVGRERNDPRKPSPERGRQSLLRFLANDLWISSFVGFLALLIDVDSRKRVGGFYPLRPSAMKQIKTARSGVPFFTSQFICSLTSWRTSPNWLR